jgi:hypothetical protein
VHCAIDDYTRLAYAEIHSDETAATCAGFLTRETTVLSTTARACVDHFGAGKRLP